MKKYLWTFIVFVAAVDICFTWRCRLSADEWESNPVAAWILGWAGASGAIAYRLGWLVFAGFMAQAHCRLSKLVTPIWAVGHLYLLVVLVQASAYAKGLPGYTVYGPNSTPLAAIGVNDRWQGSASITLARQTNVGGNGTASRSSNTLASGSVAFVPVRWNPVDRSASFNRSTLGHAVAK